MCGGEIVLKLVLLLRVYSFLFFDSCVYVHEGVSGLSRINKCVVPANVCQVSITLLSSFRRWEVQVLSGHQRLASAGRPPAATALASPPRVHTQPHGGRPDLGPDRPRPGALRASPHPGARRHPSQHEAAGEQGDSRVLQCFQKQTNCTGDCFMSARQLWMRLSGALQKKRTSEISYREVIKNSSGDDTTVAKQVESCLPHFWFPWSSDLRGQRCSRWFVLVSQIEKDLLRTMPSNACFNSLTSVGVPRLRRVLRGLAWLYPDIGYCQGTGMVRPPGPPSGTSRVAEENMPLVTPSVRSVFVFLR